MVCARLGAAADKGTGMADKFTVVGHSERRVDGYALVTGKPVFAADVPIRPGTLHLALKTSPHAHARIRSIDASRAVALPGVALVLTHENTPTKRYTTAGQGYPEPSPYDARMFDSKVRFVGDRVAAVAAESAAVAREACGLIEVEYEVLEPVLSLDEAIADGAPLVHDAESGKDAWDATHNIAAHVEAVAGDVETALAAADVTVDVTVESHYGQHAPIENHVAVSHLDEHDRLVITTSTQVPFHARRILAHLLDVPVHRIRVIKPRIGGGFGVKQEILIEDLVAFVTLTTGRPARIEYTRGEELVSSRTRHPMRVRVRLGASADGRIDAVDMYALSNTGAYGTHSLTVLSNAGSKSLPMYNLAPHVRFLGDAVYTNLPVGGAFRGYGGTQGQFAMEVAIDQLAEKLGMDALVLRDLQPHPRRRHVTHLRGARRGARRGRADDLVVRARRVHPHRGRAHRVGGQARGAAPRRVVGPRRGDVDPHAGVRDPADRHGCSVDQAQRRRVGEPRGRGDRPRDGVGHRARADRGGGARDPAREGRRAVVGHRPHPVRRRGVRILDHLRVRDGGATGSRGGPRAVGRRGGGDAAGRSGRPRGRRRAGHRGRRPLGHAHRDRAAVAVRRGPAADRRDRLGGAGDLTAAVPRELRRGRRGPRHRPDPGGRLRRGRRLRHGDQPRAGRGAARGRDRAGPRVRLVEDLAIDDAGRARATDFARYKIPGTLDFPRIEAILVDSYDPTGPMGAKSIAEIGINAPLPTIANAVHDATGIWLTESPFTPEKVWRALQAQRQDA
jgi:CO/xanthine dehydrogenase Mo-binding subunit